MPIRAIILRVEEDEFKAYEALKRPKDSWESMFRREMSEKVKYKPPKASNGRILTPTLWHGDIPEGWVPLDGRTIEGVTLPDRRSVFIYGTANKVEPMAETVPAICVLCEIVRIHDLVVDGKVVLPGVMP